MFAKLAVSVTSFHPFVIFPNLCLQVCKTVKEVVEKEYEVEVCHMEKAKKIVKVACPQNIVKVAPRPTCC